MKVLLVAGARPNFMKIAPILAALTQRGHECVLVHTGQHYDALMSDTFFSELGISDPDWHLGAGGGSQAEQLARVILGFEPVLLKVRPDWVVVVGDVTSTLGAALVTAKLKGEVGCRLAHVEAGLRSNDWNMPEEVNRVLTDRVSDLLLTPSEDANANLAREGIASECTVFVGNVMIDTLMAQLESSRERKVAPRLGLEPKKYALLTLHRPSNVDDPGMLTMIMNGIQKLSETVPVVFPVHPRTRERIASLHDFDPSTSLLLIEPVPYRDMLSLTGDAALVLTDSGGLQEETTILGIPCVTLREQTERPITVSEGTNTLIPWPPTVEGILAYAMAAMNDPRRSEPRRPDGWDGAAAMRVAAAMEERTGNR